MKNFFLAVGIISGTIIGAGIFSLPYIFARLGIISGLIYLFVCASIYYLIHSRYSDILMSESLGEHYFLYFAKKYLSKFWGYISSVLILFELIFALTIFLILSRIFTGLIFGDSEIIAVIIFWFLSSILFFGQNKWIGWAELVGGFGILIITFFILLGGEGNNMDVPLVRSLGFLDILISFGPLLLAFSGRAAISKVVKFYKNLSNKDKFPLKKAIFWGTFLPIFIYLIFIFGVFRLVPNVTVDTLSSLGGLPIEFLIAIGIIGLLASWTSYIVVGSNIYDILRFDVMRNKWLAGLIAFFSPLILYVLGLRSFISAVSITGGLFLALEVIFVITIWLRMKGSSKFTFWAMLLYVVFGISILYQLFNIFGVSI